MTALALNPFVTYTDTGGIPLAGGKIYTYIAGTTTPQATYTDATQSVSATNPIILDAAGRSPYGAIWGNGSYKLRLTTSTDVDIYTTDNVQISASISSGTTVISGALSVAGITTTAGINDSIGITTPSINGGPLAGNRNRIINGDMRIDQRNEGAAQTFTAAGAAAYCVDRFYALCTGANVTGQRVAGTSPDQYVYQFTGAASVTGIVFGQRIEATNILDLTSKTATLSVELANSLLTTVTWTAYYPTATDNYTTKTQIATGSFTVNSTLTKYSVNIALGANIPAGLAVELSVGAQISGTWTIGQFQLEPGTVATPFERRPISSVMADCERYFTKSFPPGTAPAQNASNAGCWFWQQVCGASTASFSTSSIRWPVQMRIAPTIVFFNPAAANAQIRCINTSSDYTLTTNNVTDQKGCLISGTTPGGSAITNIAEVHTTASAEI